MLIADHSWLQDLGALKSVNSYQLSGGLVGDKEAPPTHKGTLGGGRATTRI